VGEGIKVKRRSCSFLKKRTKKLLLRSRRTESPWVGHSLGATNKSFLVLFFKKEHFFFLFLCLAVTACGKKGDPSAPGPADQIHYPKIYPTH
jgi:hypothetical protein